MSQSVGIGFPSTNLQIGHTFFDLDDKSSWIFLGGDPKQASSWRLTNGTFGSDPDTSTWGSNQAGATWFNTALGVQRTWTGTEVVSIGSGGGSSGNGTFNYKTQTVIQDDFMSFGNGTTRLGLYHWNFTAGSITTESGVPGHPGQVTCQTGGAPGDEFQMGLLDGTVFSDIQDFDMTFVFRLTEVSGNFAIKVGLLDIAAFTPSQGVYLFKGLSPTAVWQMVLKDASTTVTLSSAITNDDQYHTFRMTKVGTLYSLYIDDVLAASQDEPGMVFDFGVTPSWQGRSIAAVSYGLVLDYVEYIMTVSPARP